MTRKSHPPPPVEPQVDDGPASAADGPPRLGEHDTGDWHDRIVLRAFLSQYAKGQEMRPYVRYRITTTELLGLDRRERALRSSLRQRAEQARRHAAKLETAVEEERWAAAIQHVNDLMREERHMAYSLLAWIIKLLSEPETSGLPAYYDRLTVSQKTGVALGLLRPFVGEHWPKTYAEWVVTNPVIEET